jgi:splicing factor 45
VESRDKQTNNSMLTAPSCIVLIKNMSSPSDITTSASKKLLESELIGECSAKYGQVRECIVLDISERVRPPPPEHECVRCFVNFEEQVSAVKAVRDLNDRFFGGRQITASFYDETRYVAKDLYH